MTIRDDVNCNENKPYGTVILKAAAILSCLSKSKAPMILREISEETGINSSTAIKIMDTLCMLNYVQKNENTKCYSIGGAILQLSSQYVSNLDIVRLVMPYLHQLHELFNETVHLGIREKDKMIIVRSVETMRPVVCQNSAEGNIRPLYCSAMGKAVLAEYSDSELKMYLDNTNLVPFTSRTITDPEVLLNHIMEVRKAGFAEDISEIEEDVYCIGIVIHGWSQPAAITVSTPAYRMNTALRDEIVMALRQAQRSIMLELRQ